MQAHNNNTPIEIEELDLSILTPQERKTYLLNGIGLKTKEIADQMGVGYETVKSNMKKLKEKIGLSADKEITAHFYCKLLDMDFEELKKQIISSCLALLVFLYIPANGMITPRRPNSQRTMARTTVMTRRQVDAVTA